MKLLITLIPAFFCCIIFSCQKEKLPAGTSSFTMVNTVVGSRPLMIKFNATGKIVHNKATQLEYGKFDRKNNQFSAYTGQQQLQLLQYPDTSEKDSPLFDLSFNLPLATINTLYLTGTVNAPDTFFTRDDIPYLKDSVMAIRFLNLSPGSNPVSVNLRGDAPIAEKIGYKQQTGFHQFAVRSDIQEYIFEFHDVVSGVLLKSHTVSNINMFDPNIWLFRSFTLVLTGLPDGTGNEANGSVMVAHY